MAVRVWGVVGDRLIEVCVEPSAGAGIQIEGLPESRTRTARDRVRATLFNSALVREDPYVVIRLEPAVRAGATSALDLALALGVLGGVGVIAPGVRWILATGRLGLDGMVHADGLAEWLSLSDVVESLCQTRDVDSERMFERPS